MKSRPLVAFIASGTVPGLVMLGMASLVAVGGWMLWLDPHAGGDSAYMMVLLLQMFAVSTGFRVHAQRGHYDSILVTYPRARVAVEHWAASVMPGLAAWLLLCGWQSALSGTVPDGLFLSACTAWLIVSCIGWAVTVPAPRATGGVAWMLAMAALLTTQTGFRLITEARVPLADMPLTAGLEVTVAIVACPFLLMGDRPFPVAVLLGGAAIAILAWGAAVRMIIAADYPLEPGA